MDQSPVTDADSPGGYADEDVGDLTFPSDFGSQEVWLSRVPKWLWEALEDVEEDEEIEIGKLAMWQEADGTQKSKLTLHDLPEFTGIPKEYKMNTLNTNPANTFIFTEKDVEYDPNWLVRQGWQGAGSGSSPTQHARTGSRGRGKKRVVTMDTKLAARISHETSFLPVENAADYALFQLRQTTRAQKATKNRLILEPNLQKFTALLSGAASSSTKAAIKTNAHNLAKTSRQGKNHDNKFVRMAQNDLLDLLAALFREYRYWSFVALQQRTRQPTTYLRETVAMVAEMIKAGPFANTWVLKGEAEAVNEGEDDLEGEMAPDPMFDEDDDYDYEDEMEDVI